MHPRVRRFSGALIVLLLFSWAGCHRQPPQQQQQRQKIKVGYIPIAECAHIYVAISKKYFEEQNLEVDLQPMKGGAAILPAVQNGDLDIGFTNVASLVLLNSKLPPRAPNSFVSLVGASYERPGSCNHALLTKRDSHLTVQDLARPKTQIALNTTRNIEELMLRRYLEKNKVQATQLNIVPLAFPEMLPALQRGTVQVASVVEPFIEPALRTGKYSVLARQYLDVSPETVVATYATTRAWIARNDGRASSFIRAFEKANQFITTDPAETRQVIGSFTRIRPEDLAVMGMPAFEVRVAPKALEELIRQMHRFEFIDHQVHWRDVILAP